MTVKTHQWASAFAVALLVGLSAYGDAPKSPPEKKGRPVPDGAKVERDIEYGPHGDGNKLDLYLPEKEADHPLPLVIWIHGGGWESGDKDIPLGLALLK